MPQGSGSRLARLASQPGYRWVVLAVLTAVHATHHIDRNVVSVVVEPIRHEFHLTDSQVGLAGGLGYALAFGVAAFPIGYLVDRVNRRNLLIVILALWSGLTALSAATGTFAQLVLARMGVGAAESGASPTEASLLSDYFAPAQRSTAVGVWYLSAAIGTGLIFLVGGYLAQTFGWRAVFLVAGVPGAIMALVLLFLVREPRRGGVEPVGRAVGDEPPAPEEAAASVAETLDYVVRRPAILCLMAAIVLAAAMTSAFGLWSISFLVRVHGLKMAQASVWIALSFTTLGILIPLAAGLLGDRVAKGRTTRRPERLAWLSAGTMTAVVVSGSAAALAPSASAAIFFMGLWCGFMLAHNGPANALFLGLLRPRMRGVSVASLQIMATVFGAGLGPFFVGMLSDAYGGHDSLRWAILTGMSVNALAVVFFVLAALSTPRAAALAA